METRDLTDTAFKFGTTPFYFLRHGETPESRDGILQGQSESELNATGRGMAEAAAKSLSCSHNPAAGKKRWSCTARARPCRIRRATSMLPAIIISSIASYSSRIWRWSKNAVNGSPKTYVR